MILPIVHLNGTSKNDLIEQRREACIKLHEALDALSAMAPNGRDYYPVPGLFYKAVAISDARMATVRGIWKEVEAEAIALMDLPENRGRRQ